MSKKAFRAWDPGQFAIKFPLGSSDSPNWRFSIVTLPFQAKIAFSYQTCIGIMMRGGAWYIRENVWGPTTGKHLAWLRAKGSRQITDEEFFDLIEREFTHPTILLDTVARQAFESLEDL